jgi:hypothetical protein
VIEARQFHGVSFHLHKAQEEANFSSSRSQNSITLTRAVRASYWERYKGSSWDAGTLLFLHLGADFMDLFSL